MRDPISDKMQEGVEEGAFPGGVLLVWYQGAIIHHAAYGHACLIPRPDPASCDTVYDLASLTKPLAGVSAAVLLAAAGRIVLDDRLERYVAALRQQELSQSLLRRLCTPAR